MSKRAQRNQSAFNVGYKIGERLAIKVGEVSISIFTKLFKQAYKGNPAFQAVARAAAKIGYENGLDKAAKAAQTEPLTGGQDAKL